MLQKVPSRTAELGVNVGVHVLQVSRHATLSWGGAGGAQSGVRIPTVRREALQANSVSCLFS